MSDRIDTDLPSIHALSGAYAVDALDPDERTRFADHLTGCADCRAEVASLQETATRMGALTELAPPARLRSRVLAEIATVRPLPPREEPAAPGRRSTRRAARWVAAAAAVAVLVGGGVTVAVHPWSHPQVQLSTADRVLHARDAQAVSLSLPGGGHATVTRSSSVGRAVIVTHAMPTAPTGKTYELWLQVGGTMHPAGLMAGGSTTRLLAGDAARATAAAVTVEPAGGSAQPTTQPIALFDLEASS